MVWSMPPQAVPACLSALIVNWASVAWSSLERTPLAWAVVMAAQTVKAEEEDRPAAGGTRESIRIFMPFGLATSSFTGDSKAKIAL